MITVKGEGLEAGDTVVFRCGGQAVVSHIIYGTVKGWYKLSFNGSYSKDEDWYETGKSGNSDNFPHFLDIIDIKKKPKPEVITIYKDVFTNNSSSIQVTSVIGDDCVNVLGGIYLNIDLINKKILSVEVVKND